MDRFRIVEGIRIRIAEGIRIRIAEGIRIRIAEGIRIRIAEGIRIRIKIKEGGNQSLQKNKIYLFNEIRETKSIKK